MRDECGGEGERGTGSDCSHWAPLACPLQPPLTVSLPAPSSPRPAPRDWSLKGRARGADLLSGPQGAVLRSLQGTGALAARGKGLLPSVSAAPPPLCPLSHKSNY